MRIRRLVILFHRWLGVALCVLFGTWFISGIVLMYWTYPGIDAAARLAHQPALNPDQLRLSPQEAWTQLQLGANWSTISRSASSPWAESALPWRMM